MRDLFSILSFGMLGVFLRFSFTRAGTALFPFQTLFPWVTFCINLTGSFLIGILYSYFSQKNGLNDPLAKGLLIGLLGGFTTFSSFSLETLQLWQLNERNTAITYVVTSVLIGLLLCVIGYQIGSKITYRM